MYCRTRADKICVGSGLDIHSPKSETLALMQVLHYLTADGEDVYQTWLDELRDMRARVAIQRRADRLAAGNVGDHKFCRDGVWELRIDVAPGYRVYYARAGQTIVLLLSGGDKRRQDAEIERAVGFWNDWQRRP